MDGSNANIVDESIKTIYALFFDDMPVFAEIINTSRDESDFRNAVIITSNTGEKHVLKISSNDFTFPEKIAMWQRTIEEYRDLGYYCPRILADKQGAFPKVKFQGCDCYVYAEEYSKYRTLGKRGETVPNEEYGRYIKDIWCMTAKIAAKRLEYTDYPSGYCLFDTFCPSDKTDEILENALLWKELTEKLPEEYTEQAQRIWKLWSDNREILRKIYLTLPTSVFQADLNSSNLLIDETGKFVGILDFNLCGKEVFLNYLMRENDSDSIPEALKISSEYYTFSEEEKQASLPLYRCLKSLWNIDVAELEDAENHAEAIRQSLDRAEECLTKGIDFRSYME